MKRKILILALLGDPTIPAGIPFSGGFNQTLRELITALAAFKLPICIITDTSAYRSNVYKRISKNIELFRVPITEIERNNQENLSNAQERILQSIYETLGEDIDDIKEPRKNCVKEDKRQPFSQESEQGKNLIERMYFYTKLYNAYLASSTSTVPSDRRDINRTLQFNGTLTELIDVFPSTLRSCLLLVVKDFLINS